MAFHVGQRVVCIKNDAWSEMQPGEVGPAPRGVYTIRTLTVSRDDGDTYLRFHEIKNPELKIYLPVDDGLAEARFWAIHFRPVKETDISIFTAMLAPTPKQKQRVTTSNHQSDASGKQEVIVQ